MFEIALIPAAGRGARLDRLGTPKPLVEVGGEGILVRLLRQLAESGIREAVIVVGYLGDRIREETEAAGPPVAITWVEHPAWAEGLASSLDAAKNAIGDRPFLLAMADHVFDDTLVARMARVSPPDDGLAALLGPPDAAKSGCVRVQGRRAPTAFGRELETWDAVDAGLFGCSPALFDALSAGDDLAHAVDALAREGRVCGVMSELGRWDDVDRPADVVRAEMRLRTARRRARITPVAPAPVDARFTTGAAVETEIIVGRGLVRDPLPAVPIPIESASSPVFVFTDHTVDRLYGDAFVGKLKAAGYDVHRIVMTPGEEAKTLSNYAYLAERVVRRGLDERSVLISLGGGVVCNVCGMLAATLYRGVRLVHVPTTLMAQCDAAISHKQAVNDARGKNLIGAYYAPRRIIVDPDVLQTLTDRQLRDGMAEVLKHALAQDAEFADWLEQPHDLRDVAFLEYVVRRNITLKCQLMASDPTELAEGMVLQYGHTVGHPVEFLSGYEMTHGEAVAVGMMVAAQVARLAGACDDATVVRHARLIRRYGLPTSVPDDISFEDIVPALRVNKRYLREGTRMALVSGVGALWNVDGDYTIPVSDRLIEAAVDACRAETEPTQEVA